MKYIVLYIIVVYEIYLQMGLLCEKGFFSSNASFFYLFPKMIYIFNILLGYWFDGGIGPPTTSLYEIVPQKKKNT